MAGSEPPSGVNFCPSRFQPEMYQRLNRYRRPLAYTLYGVVAAAAYLTSFLLRFEFDIPTQQATVFFWTLPAVVLVRVVFARVMRLSAGRWRFISTNDFERLFLATTAGTALLYVAFAAVGGRFAVPRSVLLIEWGLTTYATAALWLSYRVGFERLRQVRHTGSRRDLTRALLVGAGEAGNLLAREMQRFPTGYRLVGFVDDDPLKWGCRIQGCEVLGGTRDLAAIAQAERIDEIAAVDRITNFVLGRYRRTAEPETLDDFRTVFRTFARNVYEQELSNYAGQTLDVTGSVTRSEDDFVVRSKVTGGNGEPTKVNWRIQEMDGELKVLDAQVGGIWLAQTQRDQITSVIGNAGGDVSAAIEQLCDRIADQDMSDMPAPCA